MEWLWEAIFLLQVNDYVRKKGQEKPTGIVEDVLANMVTVRWGVADKRIYRENCPMDDLEIVDHEIISPEDVSKLRIHEDGHVYLEGD